MKKNLTWSKGLFTSIYQIYSNGKQLGNLIDKPFSRTIKGKFNGKEYLFQNSGFFNQYTEIVDWSASTNYLVVIASFQKINPHC